MKKELNKWQFGLKFGKCPEWRKGFYPFIKIWCLKFLSFPPEGEMFDKKNYKGFFKEWIFQPIITIKIFRIGKKCFSIPIKIKF